MLSREVVESLSLGILKSHPHVFLDSCISLVLLEQDNWTKWFFLPPEVPSNFSHSVKDSLEIYWVPGLSLLFSF